jgi:carbon storage regulator CsrA
MLVLSRDPGESVVLEIGDEEIEVAIVAVRGNRVRLGFKMPDRVNAIRKELIGDPCVRNDRRPHTTSHARRKRANAAQ